MGTFGSNFFIMKLVLCLAFCLALASAVPGGKRPKPTGDSPDEDLVERVLEMLEERRGGKPKPTGDGLRAPRPTGGKKGPRPTGNSDLVERKAGRPRPTGAEDLVERKAGRPRPTVADDLVERVLEMLEERRGGKPKPTGDGLKAPRPTGGKKGPRP